MKKEQVLTDYLLRLEEKGFRFSDEMIAFIYFGKASTDASDLLVMAGIEVTLKAQKEFDGSFFLSLLEWFKEKGIADRETALRFAHSAGLL
ncbi:hypothetical protein AC623_12070 [Bacillus sp. FJAT-27231]|uniref:DUF6123 family protein n=1 Tax=Bacillus sp. FJAT-27231 TaxID=1679168 RepID=UPI00067075CA|nr:DUF6123 family protein [Bacillus sp. FJAT-27231]KMY54565.1 hypothetical protein AC623_12070 [Bacillus sp. FJAT-27231]